MLAPAVHATGASCVGVALLVAVFVRLVATIAKRCEALTVALSDATHRNLLLVLSHLRPVGDALEQAVLSNN